MARYNTVGLSRRDFLAASGAVGLAATWGWDQSRIARAADLVQGKVQAAENAVQHLFASLSPEQRAKVCFDWDYIDPKRGLLRTHVANNWQITDIEIQDDFYTKEQQALVRQIFEGITQPEWHARFDQQLEDDAGGWGHEQSIAIFGSPLSDKFEFVLTGRHMTVRCDGNSADHMAFGGPIFYGHAPDFNEGARHEGNVFWHQALAANRVYEMLDADQRKIALIATTPREQSVGFQGTSGNIAGIPVRDMTGPQKADMQKVLAALLEPYRQSDRDEVAACLQAQGGLDACHLSFYQDNDIGQDGVWDNWRLEGPSFVWYFRGSPHVHVWVNVSDSSDVALNA